MTSFSFSSLFSSYFSQHDSIFHPPNVPNIANALFPRSLFHSSFSSDCSPSPLQPWSHSTKSACSSDSHSDDLPSILQHRQQQLIPIPCSTQSHAGPVPPPQLQTVVSHQHVVLQHSSHSHAHSSHHSSSHTRSHDDDAKAIVDPHTDAAAESNTNNNHKTSTTSPSRHLLAGAVSGALTTCLLYPFDLVKTRFQVNTGQRRAGYGTLKALLHIRSNEGWRAWYKGFGCAIVGAGLSWGMFMYLYNRGKSNLRDASDGQSDGTAWQHFVESGKAGVLTSMATNPLWLCKTRLQLQLAPLDARFRPILHSNLPHVTPYNGLIDCIRRVVSEEGVSALYKGLVPNMLLASHGAVQFMTYDALKFGVKQLGGGQRDNLSGIEYFGLGAVSKIVASVTTYPLNTLRSRLQQQPSSTGYAYSGVWDAFTKIYRYESFRGFYKGLVPNLYRVTPYSALTLLFYEQVLQVIQKFH